MDTGIPMIVTRKKVNMRPLETLCSTAFASRRDGVVSDFDAGNCDALEQVRY
jgi:hypothetical protein